MIKHIGIFDSGVGGFSVLRKVIERHPNLQYVYLADTARVPYGEKEVSEIRLIAREVVQWLTNQKVSLVLVGCNTTNSLALDIVQRYASSPVLDLIQSVSAKINTEKVGVLATPATTRSKAYTRHIQSAKPGTFVLEQACPLLVPMIEAGHKDSNEISCLIQDYLRPLLNQNVESIVLGCTHYPLLSPLLRELLPSHVELIDPAEALARQMDKYVGSPITDVSEQISTENIRIFVTSDSDAFRSRAKSWLGRTPEVERISLQQRKVSSRI